MTSGSAREFFLGSAGVAGALIGLLFVAISVASERVLGPDASEAHSVRAAAALTAFTNALTVSLFALVPGLHVGGAVTAVAAVGLLFVAGSLLRVVPVWRAGEIKLLDVSFLFGLFALFVTQMIIAIQLDGHPRSASDLQSVCILVVICFLIGIARSWELVGGPSIVFSHELVKRVQKQRASPRSDAGAPAPGDGDDVTEHDVPG